MLVAEHTSLVDKFFDIFGVGEASVVQNFDCYLRVITYLFAKVDITETASSQQGEETIAPNASFPVYTVV